MRRRLVVHLPFLRPVSGREVGARTAALRLLRPQADCQCQGCLVFTSQIVERALAWEEIGRARRFKDNS